MNENSNAEKKPTETNWKLGCIRELLIARHTPKNAVEKIIDRFGQEIEAFDNWRNACIFSEFVDTLRERYFMEDEKDACTCGTPWSGIHESMCPCFNASEKPGEVVQAEPYPDTRSELQKESSESDGERYRFKGSTLEVDAIRWMGSNTPAVLNFGTIYHEGRKDCPLYRVKPNAFFPTLSVDTGEGYVQVNCGDWVIRDSSQEFAVVPDASFQKMYEPKQDPQVLQVYREMLARWELSTCYLVSFIEHNCPCNDRTETSEWAKALKSLKEMQETLGGRLKPNPKYFNPGPEVFEIQPNVPKIEKAGDPQEPRTPSEPFTPECRAQLLDEFSDSTPAYDMSIHGNPDARAWAKSFVETINEVALKRAVKENTSKGAETLNLVWDLDYMHGWFANAMMAMHDHLKQGQVPPGIDRQCKEWLEMEERETSHYAQAAELARQICVANFQPEAQGWEPLKDLPGVLSQISNMAAAMSAKITQLDRDLKFAELQSDQNNEISVRDHDAILTLVKDNRELKVENERLRSLLNQPQMPAND